MEREGKIGPRAQRLAYISLPHSRATITPSKLFSLPLKGLFFPVCSRNYVNDEGILFFLPVAE